MKLAKRLLALFLCLSLLATPALAAAMGNPVLSGETMLAGGVSLADGVYWGSSDFRSENYLAYTPSTEIFPMVVYGSKLCNYGSFRSMTSLLESQGYHVLGGINGDYYNTSSFCPLGIVIENGKLISSDAGHYAVGFLPDGSAIAGTPALTMTMDLHGEKYPLSSVNKVRDTYGFALFTDQFAANTKNNRAGRDIILRPVEGELAVGKSITLEVEEIRETTSAIAIPEGKYILSLSYSADNWRQAGVDSLHPGDQFTLEISSPDARWAQVQNACGSLYKLITDGAIVSGLPSGSEPRSAVGIRPDGSTILYTIDGRQSGYSSGASMTQVAQRLLELGCTEACLMDGGGSTSLNARYIGGSDPTLINRPSDGSPRSVTSYIVLVTRNRAGAATRLGLSPTHLYLLAGAQTQLTPAASDDFGWAAATPAVEWSTDATMGSVTQDGMFIAGKTEGKTTVTVSSPGLLDGEAQVEVVTTPHILTVKNQATGKTVSSLQLKSGESIDLTATAQYYTKMLTVQDSCFSWSVTPGVGTIDSNGKFTAANHSASGTITVSAGTRKVEIPVSVQWTNPFDDVSSSDWFYNQISYVHGNGLFAGETSSHFGVNSGTTRGMFVTVLWRMVEQPTANGTASFTDVADGAYYADAVRWAAGAGIVSGYTDGSFRPDRVVTREELCTLLYRYALWHGDDLSGSGNVSFADDAQISAWARQAVQACVSAGLLTGEKNPDGSITMSPSKAMSRATAAVLLARYHERYF